MVGESVGGETQSGQGARNKHAPTTLRAELEGRNPAIARGDLWPTNSREMDTLVVGDPSDPCDESNEARKDERRTHLARARPFAELCGQAAHPAPSGRPRRRCEQYLARDVPEMLPPCGKTSFIPRAGSATTPLLEADRPRPCARVTSGVKAPSACSCAPPPVPVRQAVPANGVSRSVGSWLDCTRQRCFSADG